MMWPAIRFCSLAAGVLILACDAGGALAHAVLTESRPADGASLIEPPVQIELRFNEPVIPVAVRLMGEDGRELPGVAVEAHGEAVVIRPPQPLAAGGYFLSYRVTSLDAHAVGATLRFGIGAPAPGTGSLAALDRELAWLAAASRWLVYLTALGAVGAALFVASVRPPVSLESAVRGLAVAGLDLGGLPLRSLLTARPWAIAAGTSLGPASAMAGLGLVAIMAGYRLPRWALALGSVAVAASFALTGHAASAEPRLLTGAALWVHVLCAAFWLGSLLPLLWSLGLPHAAAAAVLRRFSHVAMAAVAMLIMAGVALTWVQLDGSPAGLWQTAYGQRLLAKLALVAGLLALALVNRFALAPAVAEGHARSTRRLRASLFADIALGLAVLAVTATFPLSPPPRALASQISGITVVASGRVGQATLTLVPGRVGANRLEAGVADRDGVPVTAREATVAWSLPAAGIEPVRVDAGQPLPGVVFADRIVLPRAGRWRLRLDLLIDDFTRLTYGGEIDVQ
jgi:copper transport protein